MEIFGQKNSINLVSETVINEFWKQEIRYELLII